MRTQIDAGGRPHVRLVRTAVLDSVASLIDAHDVAFEPQPDVDKESSDEGGVSQDRPTIASTPRFASRPAAAIEQRDWHRRGGYAYHAGHESAAQSGAWAMVIDGSASMRVRDQGEVARLLEAIIGITIAARLGGPESVGVTRLNGSRELGPDLDHDVADWSTLFSGAPSPWSQVTPAVRAAAQQVGPGGLVVLVVDGTPVDALDLVGWSKENPERIELHVVALGRSGSKHREALRWWEDELVVLAPLREAGHRLVAIDGPAAVADHPTELADDLYPRERG
ncbi:hypothetical protein [Janibacter sp. GXQ6167]|uniref:hypothetical protein n=1 Tax=Janibacter sp. GXQ6167 TaxID=3240791 RepID=UPI0035242480